tara:strand:+ start:1016 stop:1459 length:444 start_codon:yes stop_codon:yes gene_type:complete
MALTKIETFGITDAAIGGTQISVGSLAGANTVFTHRNSTFSVAQRGGITDHGTLIANTAFRQNLSVGNMYKMTLGGNITINNPTNQVAGQAGVMEIVNGGSYTVSWGSDWDFAAGTAPVITASGTDILSYYVTSANNIVVDALQAVS